MLERWTDSHRSICICNTWYHLKAVEILRVQCSFSYLRLIVFCVCDNEYNFWINHCNQSFCLFVSKWLRWMIIWILFLVPPHFIWFRSLTIYSEFLRCFISVSTHSSSWRFIWYRFFIYLYLQYSIFPVGNSFLVYKAWEKIVVAWRKWVFDGLSHI